MFDKKLISTYYVFESVFMMMCMFSVLQSSPNNNFIFKTISNFVSARSTNFFARLFFLHDDTRSPPRGLQRMLVIFLNNRKKLKLSNCTSYSGHFCVPIAEFRNLHVFFIRSSSLQYRNKILQFKFLALSTHFSKLNSEILTLIITTF